ncbi:MAG: response regulator [Methylocystaceae bacterium]|nr:response regulator [Methylocystaceae bacterium]
MQDLPHILFVDDDLSILSSIKRNLHRSRIKWKFSYAQSGSAALTLLRESEKIDVVVTDVMMPGINGYELVQEIRKEYPDIHIIVLSGHCDAEDREEFEKIHIPFFTKPFPVLDLTTAISLLVNMDNVTYQPS